MTEKILGTSDVVKKLREQIVRAAQSESKILILGDNGTGKELVAEAIHQHSRRHDRHFVALNCAAVPESLLEAEIFGHEKGAFTGAVARRTGVFERADHGTLFLDEIGDMSLTMQAKLLRVLQSGTFERIGGHETLQVNVRVIAATNKNLRQAVKDKTFREDLYHRIAVLPIRVPPLWARASDIPELTRAFLARSPRPSMELTPEAIEVLQRYEWPGNIRQLINIIDRFVALAPDNTIQATDVDYVLSLDDEKDMPETYISREIVVDSPREIVVDPPTPPPAPDPRPIPPSPPSPVSAASSPAGKRKCEVDGCERKHAAKGKCRMHYERWRDELQREAKSVIAEPDTTWEPVAPVAPDASAWEPTIGSRVQSQGIIAVVTELCLEDGLVGVSYDEKNDYWDRAAIQEARAGAQI